MYFVTNSQTCEIGMVSNHYIYSNFPLKNAGLNFDPPNFWFGIVIWILINFIVIKHELLCAELSNFVVLNREWGHIAL